MKYVIDRIEGNILILENDEKRIVEFLVEDISNLEKYKEGNIIDIDDNGNIIVLRDETIKRKKEIEEKTKDLWS